MKIKTYNKLHDSLIQDIYEFALLMEDNNSPRAIVFAYIYFSLKAELGVFSIGFMKNKKIGFSYLAKGAPSNPMFRRLKYFAVKRELRKKGCGSKFLKTIIKEEINLSIGCELACHPSLLEFYKNLNFQYKHDGEARNEIILSLCSNIENRNKDNHFYDVIIEESSLRDEMLKLEKEYNIELLSR